MRSVAHHRSSGSPVRMPAPDPRAPALPSTPAFPGLHPYCAWLPAEAASSKKRSRQVRSPFDESQTEYVRIPSAVKRRSVEALTEHQQEVAARQKAGKQAASVVILTRSVYVGWYARHCQNLYLCSCLIWRASCMTCSAVSCAGHKSTVHRLAWL